MELRSFGPSYKSKIRQKSPPTNLQWLFEVACNKKTTGRAESSLCPKCCLEDEAPNHHVGNCKLYQHIRVKYFGITKTIVHNVVTKCNINKLATYT